MIGVWDATGAMLIWVAGIYGAVGCQNGENS
jgi:hypothetical protein